MAEETRDDILELAAKVCDTMEAQNHAYTDSHTEGLRDAADLLGQQIRALKSRALPIDWQARAITAEAALEQAKSDLVEAKHQRKS